MARFMTPYIIGLIHALLAEANVLKDCQNGATVTIVEVTIVTSYKLQQVQVQQVQVTTVTIVEGIQQTQNAITAAESTRDAWISWALTVRLAFAS